MIPAADESPRAQAPGHFELTVFGSKRRLAWSKGACPVRATARVLFTDRHALIVEAARLTVADAERAAQVQIAPFEMGDVTTIAEGWLIFHSPFQLSWVRARDLSCPDSAMALRRAT